MKYLYRLLFAFLLIVLPAGIALAQSAETLDLGLSRDFGYGGFNNDIQGLFTIKVKNPPASVVKVSFLIDAKVMGEDDEAPFSLQFNTDSYSEGYHDLSAIGYSSSGQQIKSEIIQVKFVPASAASGVVLKIILPIVGVVFLGMVLAIVIPLLGNKGKVSHLPLGTPQKYGLGGGAICPKCGRPFPLKLWWLNIGLSKIDRCPHCGKWSFVRPRSLTDLRAAEVEELSQARAGAAISGESEAEKLHKELDDSRFQNM